MMTTHVKAGGAKLLPNTLYVKVEKEGTDSKWFNAQTDTEQMVDVGEETAIGVYKLVDIKELRGEVVEVKRKK